MAPFLPTSFLVTFSVSLIYFKSPFPPSTQSSLCPVASITIIVDMHFISLVLWWEMSITRVGALGFIYHSDLKTQRNVRRTVGSQ